MARPTRTDLEQYQEVLRQIATRLRFAQQLLAQPVQQVELIAVELRMALELIVLGSLVTNRQAIAQVSSVLKVKDAKGARKLARQVNPGYWPEPLVSGPRNDAGAFTAEPFEGDYLRETQWGTELGFLGELVHAQPPHSPPRDDASDLVRLQRLYDRMAILLRQHWILLAGDQDAYLGRLDVDGSDNKVFVAVLARPEAHQPWGHRGATGHPETAENAPPGGRNRNGQLAGQTPNSHKQP